MSSGSLPNLFVLGAAKCGTGSLHQWLDSVPDVSMSRVKEPNHFTELFPRVRDRADYLSLFDGDAPWRGESSHTYLTDPGSAQLIFSEVPDARFIVSLRDPATRAHSLYHHMRRHGYEWLGTFEAALAAEPRRLRSPRFRRWCPQYVNNYAYVRSGRYGEQLERYLEHYEPDRFLFLCFDDLATFSDETASTILRFLDLPDDHRASFPEKNVIGSTANRAWLHHLVHRAMRDRDDPLRTVEPRRVARARAMLDRHNLVDMPPLDDVLRAEIRDQLRDDLARTRELTGLAL